MSKSLFIKMALDSWQGKIRDTNMTLDKISDEQLEQEVAPGKNRGTYILGHLIAVHDRMIPLLILGERLYPELDEIYIDNPDKVKPHILTPGELRQYWQNINSILNDHFSKLSEGGWFERHTAVSAEAFAREPHRNRLNVLLSRTNHLSYHQGQLILMKG